MIDSQDAILAHQNNATDFLSLDKRNKIGYNSDVKLGKGSGPCR